MIKIARKNIEAEKKWTFFSGKQLEKARFLHFLLILFFCLLGQNVIGKTYEGLIFSAPFQKNKPKLIGERVSISGDTIEVKEEGGLISARSAGATFIIPSWNIEKGAISFWFKTIDWKGSDGIETVFIRGQNKTKKKEYFIVESVHQKYGHPASFKSILFMINNPPMVCPAHLDKFAGLKSKHWYHLTLTWNNKAFSKFYLDGKLIYHSKKEFKTNGIIEKLTVGANRSVKSYMIKDLQVYNRSLSDIEVKGLSRTDKKHTIALSEEIDKEVRNLLIPVVEIEKQPVLDGKISPGEYPSKFEGLIDTSNHSLYSKKADIYMGYDSDFLYVGASVRLPYGYQISDDKKGKDNPDILMNSDAFCIFLSKDNKSADKTFNGPFLMATPSGQLYDTWEKVSWTKNFCKRDLGFNPLWKVKSSINDKTWTIEMAIKIKYLRLGEIKKSTKIRFSMGFVFRNLDLRLATLDHSIWFDNWTAMGELLFAGKQNINLLNIGDISKGVINIDASLKNLTKSPFSYDIKFDIYNIEKKSLASKEGMTEFSPSTTEQSLKGKCAYSLKKQGIVKPSQKKTLKDSSTLEQKGELLAQIRITKDNNPVLTRSFLFVNNQPLKVNVIPRPFENKIQVKVKTYGLDQKRWNHLSFNIMNSQKRVVTSFDCYEKAFEFEKILPLDKITEENYFLSIVAKDKNGKEIAKLVKSYKKRPLPVWKTNPIGLEALDDNWVPFPYTPLKVKSETVNCWGRQYVFKSGLVSSIKSQSKELIRKPIQIKYTYNNKVYTINFAAIKFTSMGNGRVIGKILGGDENFKCLVKHTIEFDGMVRMDIEVEPKKSIKIQNMYLEIASNGKWYFMQGLLNRGDELGVCKNQKSWQKRIQCLWIGDAKKGIVYFAENEKGWLIDSRIKRSEIKPDKGGITAKIYFVNKQSSINSKLLFTVGVQATPVKPKPKRLNDIRMDGYCGFMPNANIWQVHSMWWNSCLSKPSPRNYAALNAGVKFAHTRNVKFYPYFFPAGISAYNNLDPSAPFSYQYDPKVYKYKWRLKDKPGRVEDYFYYRNDWDVIPAKKIPTGRNDANADYFLRCSPSSSFADYFIYNVAEMLKKSKIDGMTIDGALPSADMSKKRGNFYSTLDGEKNGTIEIFALRNLLKRLQYVFLKARGKKKWPFLIAHGFPVFTPIYSLYDICYYGESFKPKKLGAYRKYFLANYLAFGSTGRLKTVGKPSFDAACLRIMFGKQFGPYPVILPQYGWGPLKNSGGIKGLREVLSFTLVNNIGIWPVYISRQGMNKLWGIKKQFGLSNADFHQYSDNEIIVDHKGIKVSYYKKISEDKYLFIAANWSEKNIKTSIKLPGGLETYHAYDPSNREVKDIKKGWNADIPKLDFRLLIVEKK